MLEAVILVISVFVSTGIGLFVYARNPAHSINRLYGALTLLLTFFPVANYLSLHTDNRLFFIRTVVFLSSLLVAALYYLVYVLGTTAKPFTKWQRIGVYYTLFVALLTYTPLVFSRLGAGKNPSPVPNVGSLLFFVQLIVFLLAAVVLLLRRIRNTEGVQRQQYLYMLVGIAPMFLLAPITGFILPVLFQNASFIWLSPIYTSFFVCMIGYAIIKHKLFDIRFFVVRSVAYVATLVVMAAIFGLIVFGSLRLLMNIQLSLGAQVYISVATALAALIFSNLKSFFDRISNNLFYQDAYDGQLLLDELNRLLVANTNLGRLVKRSANLIQDSLRAEFCRFGVHDDADASPIRFISADRAEHSPKNLDGVEGLLKGIRSTVIVTDELEDEHRALRTLLQENGVALVGQLDTSASRGAGGIGYMVLGQRRSGNPYTSKDVRILEIVVNELVIAIENSLRFEQIQHFNETLQDNISEATRKLRQTNEKLQGLDATKDEFITMASHQLRTPLTAVKGYLSMVLEGDAGKLNANQRKLLEQSYISSQRMVYLIADLLNLSRLSTGRFIIEAVPTNLADVVQAEVDQLRETARSRELTLDYTPPVSLPDLMLDETKIHQVVMNFIDNAIYYTPPGGTIKIELRETPQAIEYVVHDSGIGVPRSEQRHLFTKFYRADNAKKARPDGTGLGLFMAKKVIAAQGGAIIFESEEGKGSTFGFRFGKRSHATPTTPPSL